MTRKLPILCLVAAAVMALLLYVAQSDTARASVPLIVTPQPEAATEDTDVAITLTADHADGSLDICNVELTFTLTSLPTDGTLSVGGVDIASTGVVPAGADNPCIDPPDMADLDTDTATVHYSPDPEFNGPDSFTYAVAHGPGITGDVTVVITVAADDDAPVAADQTVTTSVNTAIDVTLTATDIDNCDLEFKIDDTGTVGTVSAVTGTACALNDPQTDTTPNSDSATVTFTPGADFNGDDTFIFSVDDGVNPVVNTTVTVAVNDQPEGADQSLTPSCCTPVTITLAAIDVEDCDLTFAVDTTDTTGTVSGVSDVNCVAGTPNNSDSAEVTYTPTLDFSGPDSFTFTVTDASGASNAESDVATVSISVAANTQPVADVQTVTTPPDTPIAITLTGSDAETCELEFSDPSGPTPGGTLVGFTDLPCAANPDSAKVYYFPDPGFTGTDSFTFTVTDDSTASNNTSVSATVEITVEEPPTILGDCDCDGDVDAMDALAILRDVAKLEPLVPCP